MGTFDQRANIAYDPNAGPLYRPTYAASTNGVVTLATAAGTTTSIAYLFHSAANAKRIEIQQIIVSVDGTGGKQALSIRGNRISAENGAPGGTSQTINAFDQGDAASTLIFRTGATGAPTRVTGDLFSAAADDGTELYARMLDMGVLGKPIVLQAGTNEGFEVRVVNGGNAIAANTTVGVYFIWTEITP